MEQQERINNDAKLHHAPQPSVHNFTKATNFKPIFPIRLLHKNDSEDPETKTQADHYYSDDSNKRSMI